MNSPDLVQAALPPELPPPLPPMIRPRPRIWSVLVVGLLTLVLITIVSGVIGYIVVATSGNFEVRNPPTDDAVFTEAFVKIASHLWGIALMVLPGQLIMLAAAIGAACLSTEEIGSRLGYVPGLLRWWALPLLLLGTIFAGAIGGLASTAVFGEAGPNLQVWLAMARGTSGVDFVGAMLLLSTVPAFVEETLFRGYIQRRLLQRWTPFAAIATSTAFFTLAHFDAQHMLGIIPLGFWLGYVAWRTGALWAGMVCHAAQNAVAMIGGRYGNPHQSGVSPEMIPMLVITALALLGSVLALQSVRIPREKP